MQNYAETFQIPVAAAEAYEAKFVPALFGELAQHLVDFADLAPSLSVLDVACGTGIVARTVADRLNGSGRVVGLDLNEAMLTVARRVRPEIEWRLGDAANLPFAAGSFDAVLCQMALMFFPDRAQSLREMRRVVAEAGIVAIMVPDRLQAQPAYGPFIDMVARHAGPDALSLMSAYWVCGDLTELQAVLEAAGLHVARADTRVSAVRFRSADEFVTTEVESTPLVERISASTYERIREGGRDVLRPFTAPAGRVEAPLAVHIVVARPSSTRR